MLNIRHDIRKIKTCAKFINRVGAENIIACSGRQYAGIPIEKFCEMTGAKQLLGRFMPGTFNKSITTILH